MLADSGVAAPAPPSDLAEVRRQVASGTKKLVGWSGSSRTWFTYQGKLDYGAGLISEAMATLTPSAPHATYLWELVLKLDKRLAATGIDDSNGTVGGCVDGIVRHLASFATADPTLIPHLQTFAQAKTAFGFEDTLTSLLPPV